MRVIAEAAAAVRDPATRTSGRRGRARPERRRTRRARRGDRRRVVEDRLGGGSDYTVFLNHLGVPCADLAFDGPYERLSLALRHTPVRRRSSPIRSFATRRRWCKVLGIVALRLMEARCDPARRSGDCVAIAGYVGEVERSACGAAAGDLADVRRSARASSNRAPQSFSAAPRRGRRSRRCGAARGPEPPGHVHGARVHRSGRAARAALVPSPAARTGPHL